MTCFIRKTIIAAFCAVAIATAPSAGALEMTSLNDVRNVNGGLEQRLEATAAMLTAAFNKLKDEIADILARLTALETDMTAVKTKNTEQDARLTPVETQVYVIRSKQPVDWNTPLENRLKAIESKTAPEPTPPKLVKSFEDAGCVGNGCASTREYITTSGHDFCVSSGIWHWANDKFRGGCDVSGSPGGTWTLHTIPYVGQNNCKMTCYKFQQ